jgi:hypothetical protein
VARILIKDLDLYRSLPPEDSRGARGGSLSLALLTAPLVFGPPLAVNTGLITDTIPGNISQDVVTKIEHVVRTVIADKLGVTGTPSE